MPPAKPTKPKETRDELMSAVCSRLARVTKNEAIELLCAYFTSVDLLLIRDELTTSVGVVNELNMRNVPPRVTP